MPGNGNVHALALLDVGQHLLPFGPALTRQARAALVEVQRVFLRCRRLRLQGVAEIALDVGFADLVRRLGARNAGRRAGLGQGLLALVASDHHLANAAIGVGQQRHVGVVGFDPFGELQACLDVGQ